MSQFGDIHRNSPLINAFIVGFFSALINFFSVHCDALMQTKLEISMLHIQCDNSIGYWMEVDDVAFAGRKTKTIG